MRARATNATRLRSRTSENPVERILHENPIRRIWRISYLIQCFADPFYGNIERRHGLSRLELTALHCLALSGPLRAQQIVEMLVRPKNTVSGAVHSLLRKRLIVHQPDPDDRRQAFLSLTQKGRTLYKSLLPDLIQREKDLLGALSPNELVALDHLLGKLVADVPSWRFRGDPDPGSLNRPPRLS